MGHVLACQFCNGMNVLLSDLGSSLGSSIVVAPLGGRALTLGMQGYELNWIPLPRLQAASH